MFVLQAPSPRCPITVTGSACDASKIPVPENVRGNTGAVFRRIMTWSSINTTARSVTSCEARAMLFFTSSRWAQGVSLLVAAAIFGAVDHPTGRIISCDLPLLLFCDNTYMHIYYQLEHSQNSDFDHLSPRSYKSAPGITAITTKNLRGDAQSHDFNVERRHSTA